MYLTRMQLDIKRRDTMKALTSPSMMHGAVESAFPGERKRRLWRIDCLNGKWFLMVVSEDEPDLTQAVKQFGMTGSTNPWETKDYMSLLNRIRTGDDWHFRLIANPTVCRKDESRGQEAAKDKPRGKVYAHLTTKYQEKWLLERASAYGFALKEEDFHVVRQEWYTFKKKSMNKGQVSLLAVTYEGMLHVTDKDLFCSTLCKGIGREKAFGMGMLTVAGLGKKETGERK